MKGMAGLRLLAEHTERSPVVAVSGKQMHSRTENSIKYPALH